MCINREGGTKNGTNKCISPAKHLYISASTFLAPYLHKFSKVKQNLNCIGLIHRQFL